MTTQPPKFIFGKVTPNVGRTTKYINTLIRNWFEKENIPLTKEQFIVLLRLENGPRPQSFLAMVTERNKGSLTRLVQSLEKKNYIQRTICSEDNRVNQVMLTTEGKILLEKVKPVMNQIFDSLQLGITDKEKEIALSVLLKIQENAQKELEQIDRLHQ